MRRGRGVRAERTDATGGSKLPNQAHCSILAQHQLPPRLKDGRGTIHKPATW